MSGRRSQVLDAAVRVLGAGGGRALTHRAVDAEGGLPAGTTSNHFRTRDALIGGVLGHLAATDLARSAELPAGDGSPAGLARAAAAMLRFLPGPARRLTLARYAIFLEAAVRPELQPALAAQTASLWDLAEQRLRAAGSADPARHARLLLACLDGLLIDQLVRPDPSFDPEAAVLAVLTGLLS